MKKGPPGKGGPQKGAKTNKGCRSLSTSLAPPPPKTPPAFSDRAAARAGLRWHSRTASVSENRVAPVSSPLHFGGAAPMSRKRLPDRRMGETFELEVAGLRYTCTVGRYPDGRIGELFLNNHKSNSASDANARDAAIVTSLALQNGVPLETIRRALLRDSQGRPNTPLGCALDIIATTEGDQTCQHRF
jgi:hypothetical protein